MRNGFLRILTLSFIIVLLFATFRGQATKAHLGESVIHNDQRVDSQSGLDIIEQTAYLTQSAPLLSESVNNPTFSQTAIAVAEQSLSHAIDQEPVGMNWRSNYPMARAYHAMAYDTSRGVVVMFGGRGENDWYLYNDTWEYDGINWIQCSPANRPTARREHTMVYDSVRGVIVLFGGLDVNGTILDDTWEYDGTHWVQRSPAIWPPARAGHAMAYDAAQSKVVLFGGYYYSGNEIQRSDTWEWDGTSWVERIPINHPAARKDHSMTYDSIRGVTVLFGGLAGATYKADTWEWNGTNWMERSLGSVPTSRGNFSMTFDDGRGLVVLFGGD